MHLHQNHYSEIKKEIDETGKLHHLNIDTSPLILSFPEKPGEVLTNGFFNVIAALAAASIVWIAGAAVCLRKKDD